MRGLPFETRLLRYMMLRITPVGMTEGGLAFFGGESMCFLGAARKPHVDRYPVIVVCYDEIDLKALRIR